MNEPLVSIVVPTKNAGRFLEKCLASIKNQTYKNLEIILVDNNSPDRTQEIARRYTDRVFNRGPERSAQRNFGLSEARGQYVLFVDQDMYLSKDLIREAVGLFQKDPSIKSLFIPEETIAEGFFGQCKKFERDFYLIGDRSAEAARFFDTHLTREIGGFNESNTGTEDWELSDRYLAKYPNYSRTKSAIVHDDGFVGFFASVREKKCYADSGIKRYMKIAPAYRKIPFPLRPSVRKQYSRFFRHPILAIGTLTMKFFEGLTIFGK